MQRLPELPDLFIKLKFWNKDLMVSDLTQAENNQEEKWAGRFNHQTVIWSVSLLSLSKAFYIKLDIYSLIPFLFQHWMKM